MNENIFEIEELNDEMLEAYLKLSDEQIPDLWNRIEAGYEEEIKTIKKEKNKKHMVQKYIGLAAAVLFVVIIAIPVSGVMNNKKSDSRSDKVENKTADCVQISGNDNSYYESACGDEAYGEMYNEDTANCIEQGQEVSKEENYIPKNDNSVSTVSENTILKGTFYLVDETYIFKVSEVLSCDYEEIKTGSVIYINDTAYFDSVKESNLKDCMDETVYQVSMEQILVDYINQDVYITGEITEIK